LTQRGPLTVVATARVRCGALGGAHASAACHWAGLARR